MKINKLFAGGGLFSMLTLFGTFATGRMIAQHPLYKQVSAPIEYRVKNLLEQMNIEEKVAQLCCSLGWEMYTKTGKNEVVASDLYKEKIKNALVGSFWEPGNFKVMVGVTSNDIHLEGELTL